MVHTWTHETIYKLSSDAECPERSASWVSLDDSSNPGSITCSPCGPAHDIQLLWVSFFFFNLENADGEDLPQKDITKHKKTKELRDYSDSYYRKLRMTQDSLYHVLVYGRSPLSKWLTVYLIFVLPPISTNSNHTNGWSPKCPCC